MLLAIATYYYKKAKGIYSYIDLDRSILRSSNLFLLELRPLLLVKA